jgi:hypothetical protein
LLRVQFANVHTIAADGKTIYIYDSANLQKSTDGGNTWTDSGLDTSNKLAGKVITQLVVSQGDKAYLAATDGTDLFRSTNSGQTWTSYTPAVGLDILSIDVAESANGDQAYLVGTATGVDLYEAEQGLWVDFTIGRAMAVAFSFNYASNTAVLAAIYSAGDITLKTLITNGDATQEVFSSEIQDVDIVTGATTANVVSMAFPSNYDPGSTSYNKILVGVGTSVAGTVGVYRANPKTTAVTTAAVLDTGVNAASVA